MKYLFFIGLLVAVIITAGCISENKNTIVTPTQTTPPMISTSSSTIQPFSTTVTHKETMETLGPLKTIKDSELWFTMQVPESWKVTTERLSNPKGYEGLVYMTYLYDNSVLSNTHEFYIITYAITLDFDQDVRNYYRATWTPLPNETTVKINGIIFDRFESKSDDNVKVAYVVRKGSANERGFASVIEYSCNSSSQYQQKDFESFISTFQYKGSKDIKSVAGEEIKSETE